MNPRLRTFELPTETVGEFVHRPFLLIIDRYDGEPTDFQGMAARAGAKGVVIFNSEIDLG